MGLGRNVGKLMRARGVSYADIARGIGIDEVQPIWALVKRESKKSAFAAQLAEYFKVPLERLLANDFEVDESLAHDDAKIKTAVQSDAEKLLVLIRTFLDTDAVGRDQLLKAAAAVSEAHAGATAQPTPKRARRR